MLSVEGRVCPARALPWSGLGSASGLVVVASSARSLRESVGWMPGRILVLSDDGARTSVLEDLLDDPDTLGFAGAVLLVDDDAEIDPHVHRPAPIPVVGVGRVPDQECVLHALRISLTVRETLDEPPTVPQPRRHRNRRWLPSRRSAPAHGVPGTIHVSDR